MAYLGSILEGFAIQIQKMMEKYIKQMVQVFSIYQASSIKMKIKFALFCRNPNIQGDQLKTAVFIWHFEKVTSYKVPKNTTMYK